MAPNFAGGNRYRSTLYSPVFCLVYLLDTTTLDKSILSGKYIFNFQANAWFSQVLTIGSSFCKNWAFTYLIRWDNTLYISVLGRTSAIPLISRRLNSLLVVAPYTEDICVPFITHPIYIVYLQSPVWGYILRLHFISISPNSGDN